MFKSLTADHPEKIGKALDPIPREGKVSIGAARAYLQRVTALHGVGLGAATRLLAMKRPDRFLSANKASENRIRMLFEISPTSTDDYLDIITQVWEFPWWEAPLPDDKTEQRIWRARVAILDTIFYERPAYLR
jgi:hypothetical protein